MVLYQPVIVLADIGPQDRGGEFRVVLRRQNVADIVEQRANHRFLIGPVAHGPGCRLQRVLISVDLVAHLVAFQPFQLGKHVIG